MKPEDLVPGEKYTYKDGTYPDISLKFLGKFEEASNHPFAFIYDSNHVTSFCNNYLDRIHPVKKQKKKYWEWRVKVPGFGWRIVPELMDEDGKDTTGAFCFSREWVQMEKVKLREFGL